MERGSPRRHPMIKLAAVPKKSQGAMLARESALPSAIESTALPLADTALLKSSRQKNTSGGITAAVSRSGGRM